MYNRPWTRVPWNLGATCLNPPCQTGGTIEVNGATVQLAADVQVQGVGDNRILGRGTNPTAWYSIYAIPADFIVSGATPASLYDSWTTRLNAEYAAAHPATEPSGQTGADSAGGASPLSFAGFASNPLMLAVGLGLVGALLVGRRKGRR